MFPNTEPPSIPPPANIAGSLGISSFAPAFDSEAGVAVKGNPGFPERPALLLPLIIILYLQDASAAI